MSKPKSHIAKPKLNITEPLNLNPGESNLGEPKPIAIEPEEELKVEVPEPVIPEPTYEPKVAQADPGELTCGIIRGMTVIQIHALVKNKYPGFTELLDIYNRERLQNQLMFKLGL